MLLTGEPITAATRKIIGLINRVVTGRRRARRRDCAGATGRAQIGLHRPSSARKPFYRQAEMSLAEAYRYAAEVMTENMMARDAEEGIGAFIEKREPKWQDK